MAPKAIIVGGGIGGLAAGIALRRAGWVVEVYEQAPEIREVGSGLSLWRNALAALGELGVLPEVEAAGVGGQKGGFYEPDGSTLLDMRTAPGLDTTNPGVILLLHRAELLQILLRAVGADAVTTNARCVRFEQDATGVRVHFHDGREAAGDVLIGADGLRSVIRQSLLGDGPPRYGGYTTWRAITTFPIERLMPGETWGRGRRFGQWGMTRGRTYWYAALTAPPGQADPPEGRKHQLQDLFSGWHAPIGELIAATDEQAILRNDVYDRPPRLPWSVGRVTLLGDSAHPMTPDMGQGGCQAIEDAVVLADCLRQDVDIPHALRTYEQRRITRTSRIVVASRRASGIAQWSNPLACKFRRVLLRSKFVAHKQAEQLAWMIAPQAPSHVSAGGSQSRDA